MNNQEHLKNCKECGNGFYHQGLDVCQTCKVKRQGGYPARWTNAERQAMAAQNHDPLKFNQIRPMQDSMNQGMCGGKDHQEAQNSTSTDKEYDHFELSDIFKNRLCWFVLGMTAAFILDWLF